MTQYGLLEKEVLSKLKTYACFITMITSYEKLIYFYYIRDAVGHKGLIMLSDSMPVMYLKCYVDYFSVFA